MMHGHILWALIYKDLKVMLRNRELVLSLILYPLVMLVVFPALAVMAPTAARVLVPPLAGLDGISSHLPASIQAEVSGLSARQRWDYLTLVYFLAPVYLVVPLTVASTLAADSFAGEKERKTLEALLYTPTTDQEIFVAKVLMPWLVGMGLTLIGFLLYIGIANGVAWPDMQRIFFPTMLWIVLVTWVAPAAAFLGLSTMELISVRAKSVREANQLGSVIVVPLLLLMFAQAIGFVYLNLQFALALGLVLWLVDGVLLWFGGQLFRRHRILTRL